MKTITGLRSKLLFKAFLLSALLCLGNTVPHLRSLDSYSSPLATDDNEASRFQPGFDFPYPSISLRDWRVRMVSSSELPGQKSKLVALPPRFWPSNDQLESSFSSNSGMTKKWPWDWSENVANLEKRNIVVADDAAFREKSKLLTAMERQKWLNSYIQKLLVVNSK
ncbi:tuberoinfundibular peptide of 39 residues [Erpetoichthys calabaricus]|uniref:tuberoinfundibular peptide of 39 residues n=1 Tax=Erpetoichthys calabaricus TaxID=27687 RepID=UPI00109F34BB|nr:tuberoinfundibular peptide of 39 residues [Erpetoichthys calabaricus]